MELRAHTLEADGIEVAVNLADVELDNSDELTHYMCWAMQES